MSNYDQNDNRSSGYGISGRLIGAVVLALIGFFMYLSQVEENPITGERQHVAISPDQEIRLGLASAPAMSREMGGELPANDPRTIEVQKIGATIASKIDPQKNPWKFQYHLLADTHTVNAFALPGGQVFITMGLLDKLETEAQLAGVLGHETGHVIERHTAQQMAKSQLGQALIAAVGTAASDQNSGYGGAYGPTVVAGVVNQMFQLRYGRHDELQADVWGLKLMPQLGYTPLAMIEVMDILKAADQSSGHTLEIFQTHPDPDKRIEQIKAYLAEHPPAPHLTEGRRLKDIFNSSQKALSE